MPFETMRRAKVFIPRWFCSFFCAEQQRPLSACLAANAPLWQKNKGVSKNHQDLQRWFLMTYRFFYKEQCSGARYVLLLSLWKWGVWLYYPQRACSCITKWHDLPFMKDGFLDRCHYFILFLVRCTFDLITHGNEDHVFSLNLSWIDSKWFR